MMVDCLVSKLCPTLWVSSTVGHQAPLSVGFPREHWSGLLFPSPGDLPNEEIKPVPLESPALAGGFFTTEPPRSLFNIHQYQISLSNSLNKVSNVFYILQLINSFLKVFSSLFLLHNKKKKLSKIQWLKTRKCFIFYVAVGIYIISLMCLWVYCTLLGSFPLESP